MVYPINLIKFSTRCNWLTAALMFFIACISLCSILLELWYLGFYICSLSGGFSHLQSDFDFVRPLLKNVTLDTSLFCDRDSATQYKLTHKAEKMGKQILVYHDLKTNEKSKTIFENKFLKLEASFIELTKVLELEKEKSAKDQITFIRTLSELHSFNGNKQSRLEAIIAQLQQELQVEKLQTLKQTMLIQALTLVSNDATNCEETLQRKLLNIEAEVNRIKVQLEKDLQQPHAKSLEDEELRRTQSTSMPNHTKNATV